MGTLLPLPFSAGVQDSLNPCALMTAAIMIALHSWLGSNSIKPGKFLAIFMVVLAAVSLAFNLGFFVALWSLPQVQKVSAVLYKVLAVIALVLGCLFFYDWVRLARGADPQTLPGRRLFRPTAGPSRKLAVGVAIIAALVVGIINTVWPPNYYVSLIANNFLLPGRRLQTALLLSVYTVVALWLVLLVAAVLVKADCKVPLRLQKLAHSAVFLVAGGSVLCFF